MDSLEKAKKVIEYYANESNWKPVRVNANPPQWVMRTKKPHQKALDWLMEFSPTYLSNEKVTAKKLDRKYSIYGNGR